VVSTGASDVHEDIAAYYTRKVLQFGATPHGVDWTCVPTQELRFVQLLKICDFDKAVSLNDLGCGYGALLNYLAKRHRRARIDYLGLDVSEAMVTLAASLWSHRPKTAFAVGHQFGRTADYCVASGIFNVRLVHSRSRWEDYIRSTLMELHAGSRCAYSINFLAPNTGAGPRELYRTSPEPWTRFCEQELGGRVEVLDDYGLREFTLLVRTAAHPGTAS
jgi:SAM-dependent methyltransferase